MEPKRQEFVRDRLPKIGDLFAFACGYRQRPAVLVGFNKEGGWQITILDHAPHRPVKYRKRGVMSVHSRRLVRMNPMDLNPEQLHEYNFILKELTK